MCRAQSTEDLLYKGTSAFGVRFERVQEDTFLPAPRPADVISNRELRLIVFTLDPAKQAEGAGLSQFGTGPRDGAIPVAMAVGSFCRVVVPYFD